MRLGIFVDPINSKDDPYGLKNVPAFKEAGYEFIELCVANYGKLSDEDFEKYLAEVLASGLPAEAANALFPGIYVLVEQDKALDWFKKVCVRSQRLGLKTLVFGSGGARNIPDDMTEEQAIERMTDLLKKMGPIAAEHDIVVVVEPLERAATNFINNTAEGAKFVRAVNHPNIRLLVDFFHSVRENEVIDPMDVPLFEHIHTADPANRACQTEITEYFNIFLHVLKKNGWDGRLSIESGFGPYTYEEAVQNIINFPHLLGLK